MSEIDSTEHRRVQRKVAREYRKLGFKVLETPTGEDLPAFLAGFSPDLIAISDDDRVVVEIKRADKLKGSNELTELAAKVDLQPNWRFELFTLAAPKEIESPAVSTTELGVLFKTALHELEVGNDALRRTLLVSLVSILEALVQQVALERGITISGRSMGSLVRELSFQGIVDDAMMTMLERAMTWRNAVLHGGAIEPAPDRGEIELFASNYSALQNALIEFWDGGSTDRTTIEYSAAAVSELPDDKAAIYAIQTAHGRVNYIGRAAAGHLRDQIRQHMSDRSRRIPGDRITVLRFHTAEQARHAEEIAIQEFSPKYNLATQDLESA
jgi:hypothetical protein